MLKTTYTFSKTDVKTGEAVKTHVSNSFVHQIIVRGTLSLSLEDRPFIDHPAGTMVAVPFNLKMAIENHGSETLEFFVVKVPNPRDMPPVKEI
ncbi:MAG: Cupin domain protein [Spirochaetes bacterium]|nr:MAG: Cupin domain protein [Spirochaetota bacterium]